MRDTDRLLKSKQPVMLSVVDTRNRSVTEKPVRLSVKETGMLNLKNCRLNDAKCVSGNNNILLLSRSEMEPSARTARSSAAVCRTISKSVILPQNNKISQIGLSKRRDTLSASSLQKTSWSGQTSPTLRKLSVRAVRLESKVSAPSSLTSLTSQEPNKIQTTAVKLGRKTEPPLEPINLSLKPQDTQGEDRERKLFLKIVDEKKLKYNQEDEDRIKVAERRNVSELSIIPVIKLSESPNLTETETITKDSDDEEGLENREDIDDDEESFLQRIGEEIGDMVQVKLECEADAGESQQQNKKLSFSCPKCNRTYSKKSLCELHMKKVHFGLRSKEKCNICGVRFINLQAHKEKYHYFVDVDKCHLCGKVSSGHNSYTSSALLTELVSVICSAFFPFLSLSLSLYLYIMMTQRIIVGCEISVLPPLSTAAGSQTERD